MLSKDERDKIRDRIRQQIASVQEDISALKPVTGRLTPGGEVGRLSRMDSLSRQEVAEATLAAARVRLEKLEGALRSVENPEYGSCAECGERIPLARLLLVPEADRCVRCAEN